MKQSGQNPICVSVFKNGARTTTKKEFTRVWIQLINKIEKGKNASCGKRQWEA